MYTAIGSVSRLNILTICFLAMKAEKLEYFKVIIKYYIWDKLVPKIIVWNHLLKKFKHPVIWLNILKKWEADRVL